MPRTTPKADRLHRLPWLACSHGLALLLLSGCSLVPANATATRTVLASASPLPDTFVLANRLTYDSLQDALRDACFDSEHRAAAAAAKPEVAQFVDALEMVVAGRNEAARASFASLESADDAGIAKVAARLGSSLLYDRQDYQALAARLGAANDAGARLVRVLAKLPAQVVKQAAGAALDAAHVGRFGQPEGELLANGERVRWILDTGASQTVVSRTMAKKLGIEPVDAGRVPISTATELVREAQVGLLAKLQIGSVCAENVAVLIFDDEDMTFELPDGSRLALDGIVGWPVLRELCVEVDFAKGRYAARLSTPAGDGSGGDLGGVPGRATLSWLGYPLVRCANASGQPLLFGLDTGARTTSLTESGLRKFGGKPARAATARIGGIGGFQNVPVEIKERVELAISGWRLELRDVQTESESGADSVAFFAVDGVLGCDLVQGGRLVLDYKNGRFEIDFPYGVPIPEQNALEQNTVEQN